MTRYKSSFAVPSGFAFSTRVQNANQAKKPKSTAKAGASSSTPMLDTGAEQPFLQSQAA